MTDAELRNFVAESNHIEGINRPPTKAEIEAHRTLLALDVLDVPAIQQFVAQIQPGAVLRDKIGLNVRVGQHIAPDGGREIRARLQAIIDSANAGHSPYWTHHAYEMLHPFTDGNGRSGRAIWLWMRGDHAPLGFLQHWYYESLQNQRDNDDGMIERLSRPQSIYPEGYALGPSSEVR